MFVSAGWWVAIVTLIPAADRPYIGGSQHNSILELIFGYNGFGRLTGFETGSVGGGGTATTAGQWGATGITRLFGSEMGGQVSWLIPTSLVFLAAGLFLTWQRKRTDLDRAHWVLWGSVAARHRPHLQLRQGHHPSLLHGRPRPRDRRTGRHGCRLRSGACGTPCWAGSP